MSRPTVFLDLDGVMAHFEQGFLTCFGQHPDAVEEAEMWAHVAGFPAFFANLPLVPGADAFFAAIRHLKPVILSAAPEQGHEQAAQAKRAWVAQHLGPDVEVVIVEGGTNKPREMRAPGDILIDDWQKNIRAWEAAGGRGILYKSPEQALLEVQLLLQEGLANAAD